MAQINSRCNFLQRTEKKMLDCKNINEPTIQNCLPRNIYLLIHFFLTKDGCQQGMFGFMRKNRKVFYKNNKISFYVEQKGFNSIEITFEGERLNKLIKVSEYTPFVSFNQIQEFDEYFNHGLNTSSNQNQQKIQFLLGVLNILIGDSSINKMSKVKLLKPIFDDTTAQIRQTMDFIKKMFIIYNSFGIYYYSFYQNLIQKKYILNAQLNKMLYYDIILSMSNNERSTKNINKLVEIMNLIQVPMNGGKKKTSSLSDKTVDQLRSMMKKHGKKCSKDGKRLTKDQLIRVLKRC